MLTRWHIHRCFVATVITFNAVDDERPQAVRVSQVVAARAEEKAGLRVLQ